MYRVLIRNCFFNQHIKCTCLFICKDTRKIKSFGDFHLGNLILKLFLYNVADLSFCFYFIIIQFCKTIKLVALSFFSKSTNASVE